MIYYILYMGSVMFCGITMHLYNNSSKENINISKEGISYLEFFKGGLPGIALILAPGFNLAAGFFFLNEYQNNNNKKHNEPKPIKSEYKPYIEPVKLTSPVKVKSLTLEETRMEAQRLYGTYNVHKGLPVKRKVLELTRKPGFNNKSDN